jgi:hypothetical protein
MHQEIFASHGLETADQGFQVVEKKMVQCIYEKGIYIFTIKWTQIMG